MSFSCSPESVSCHVWLGTGYLARQPYGLSHSGHSDPLTNIHKDCVM